MKTLRLLPIVVLAASALLVLKVTGLVTGGGYTLTGVSPVFAAGAESAAPGNGESPSQQEADLSAQEQAARVLFETMPAPAEGEEAVPTLRFDGETAGGPVALEVDDTERVILERLAERRAELDALAEELDLRLSVVEAAETRIEERMAELSAIEARINAAIDAQEAREAEQFASLVALYETMRPADAATIFNNLDMSVLLRVSKAMSPRKLGPIMAKMDPVRAQELTVRMAALPEADEPATAQADFSHLPQIVGQ